MDRIVFNMLLNYPTSVDLKSHACICARGKVPGFRLKTLIAPPSQATSHHPQHERVLNLSFLGLPEGADALGFCGSTYSFAWVSLLIYPPASASPTGSPCLAVACDEPASSFGPSVTLGWNGLGSGSHPEEASPI
jgi:hypothetical protein